MPVTVSYPGVYVQEEASGARAIAGVATSIAMFVGMAERGRIDTPIRIFSFADFEREFGPTTSGELATQVRNFYLNGGGQAYVMRIAQGADRADVTIRDQADAADALVVTARDPGLEGNLLRVEINYDTASPEESFNLTVFRSRLQPDGTRIREAEESYDGLSMNPTAGNFADTVINGTSALITVDAQAPAAPVNGISISGLVLDATEANVAPQLTGIVTTANNRLTLAVGSNAPVPATLTPVADIPTNTVVANIANQWTADLNAALTGNGIAATVTVEITAATLPGGGLAGSRLLRITSADGAVRITPGSGGDCAVGLMLGVASGGIEGSGYGDARPAPSGFVARMGTAADRFAEFRNFAGQNRDDVADFTITDDSPDSPHGPVGLALGGAVPMHNNGTSTTLGNARTVLDTIAAQITGNTSGRWTADRHGIRLALEPAYGTDNTGLGATLNTSDGGGGGYDFGAVAFNGIDNTAAYTVGQPGGAPGPSPFQVAAPPPTPGDNGNAPTGPEYATAYTVIGRDVDLFNLMILPRADGQTDDARGALWGPASAFCAEKRAFLIVDPRSDWSDITTAEAGVNQIRVGVETRNSACYWPRLRVANGTTAGRRVDPAGAIAGLMARTDGNRGVWKAPAGLEATVRGVIGVDRKMTDPENGVINIAALNAIRQFPAGVVSWGARTLVGFNGSGNIDDKYIPVRRTMLFIEESLYRGLRFAVFEPNDEPLWAQIRLAAGSFMNGLFRQGAFAGAKASDAYFVICDSTTTTPNDINLGIVNVVVGFAPLKPAEFVVLTVKQIAGQVQV